MKKLLIIAIISIAYSFNGNAQLVVQDPTNLAQSVKSTAELMNLGRTMKDLKSINEKFQEIKQDVAWIKNAKSVIELIRLMESTVCTLDGLDRNIRLAADLGVTKSCLDNFTYQINIRRLLLSMDQINSVLSSGKQMTPGERLSILTQIVNNFSQSNLNFEKLNTSLKKNIYREQYRIMLEEELRTEIDENIEQMANHYK